MTFLIVEHDLDFVMRASDRVVVMSDGRVISEGTPDEVRARRASRRRLPGDTALTIERR